MERSRAARSCLKARASADREGSETGYPTEFIVIRAEEESGGGYKHTRASPLESIASPYILPEKGILRKL